MLKTKTIQDLMWIANHLDTKPDDSHDMELFISDCGTCSCALGDYMIKNNFTSREYLLGLKDLFGVDAYTELLNRQYTFLFSNRPRDPYASYTGNRWDEGPRVTAARIRKFLYYFMRKSEIFAQYNDTLQTGKHLYQDAYSLEMEDISTRQEELECI